MDEFKLQTAPHLSRSYGVERRSSEKSNYLNPAAYLPVLPAAGQKQHGRSGWSPQRSPPSFSVFALTRMKGKKNKNTAHLGV